MPPTILPLLKVGPGDESLPLAKPPMSEPEIGMPERPRLSICGMVIERKSQLDAESPVQSAAYRCMPAYPPRAMMKLRRFATSLRSRWMPSQVAISRSSA